MTKRERLLTAYGGGTPDRVPVGAYHWSVAHRLYGCFCWMHELNLAEIYDWDPNIRLNPTLRMALTNYIYNLGPSANHQGRNYYEDLDDVQITLEVERKGNLTRVSRRIRTPAGDLSDAIVQYMEDTGAGWLPMPHWEERLVKGSSDLEKLKFLIPRKPYRYMIEDAVRVIEYVGDKGLVITTLLSPLDYLAGDACGLENLLVLYHDDKEFFKQLLQMFQEYALNSVRPYLEIGIKVVLLSWFYASFSAGWSPSIWEEVFYPLLKEQVDFVHSYGALADYYDDGKVRRLLPILKRAGIDCLETLTPPPVGDVTLAEAREMLGPHVCLKGGIDTVYTLMRGNRDTIFEAVERAIREAGRDGAYILFPSDPIPAETPLENVNYFVEAGRRFGAYR